MKTTEITNEQDVIDSRDIIERIAELEDTEDDDEKAELEALKALEEEASGYSSDWEYGSQLIRDSYFAEYAEELCKDIGDLPKELPWYIANHIDWDGVAEEIKQDYTMVDFNGVEYWVR